MNCSEFWEIMEDLRSTRSRNTKKGIVRTLFVEREPEDVYWSFRFLVGSPLESFDDDMGVGKKTVRKAGQQAFGVKYEEIRDKEKEAGNLSEVFTDLEADETLISRGERSPKTLEFLGANVQDISHTGSENQKISLIADMLGSYEAPQVVSFAILNDISLGISSKTLMQALADVTGYSRGEIDRAHGINPDIASIAKDLKNGNSLRTRVEPYDRIKPQLASSRDIPSSTEGWVGQYKYDGARVLIHVAWEWEKGTGPVEGEPHIKAFTRRQNDVTANMPELQEIAWPQADFIVDGEAVAYDPETGEPLKYQKIMERFQREKNIEAKREDVEVRFKLFDILYWDGEDLTELPFDERYGQLVMSFPSEMVTEISDDLETCYANALEDGHEGIIVKDSNAVYHFERDRSWRKQKPVKEPIDLEITGVVRGTGRMSDTLGAIKVQTADSVDVGRVGTGFSDADRAELWGMYQSDELVGSIVEVEFEELQENNGDYGLRFPRYSRLRPDGEADDLSRIEEL